MILGKLGKKVKPFQGFWVEDVFHTTGIFLGYVLVQKQNFYKELLNEFVALDYVLCGGFPLGGQRYEVIGCIIHQLALGKAL